MTYFVPNSFSDAPPIIKIPKEVPESVGKTIKSAFQLFWVDPSSCLNRIRTAIEEILTHEKIRRFSVGSGKRNLIQLHTRIEEYREKNPEVAEYLMALKWMGNEGSHPSSKSKEIEKSHLLNAFTILEVSLEALFDPKAKMAAKTAKK